MDWFRNLRISRKLLSSFGLIAVLAGAIGAIGSLSLANVTGKLSDAYEYNTKPIAGIGNWLEQYASMKVVLRDALIQDDPEYLASRKARFDELKQQMDGSLAQYATGIASEEERAQYNKLVETFNTYFKHLENTIQAAVDGDKARAIQLYKEGNDLNTVVNEVGRGIMQLNMKMAEQDLASNKASSQQLIAVMIVLSIVGAIAAMVLGVVISRMISRPIQTLVDASRKVADGDMNVDIGIRTKDEIGTLAQAFAAMTDSMNEVLHNISNASEQVASGSRQVSEASQELSQGSTEQASSIQQLTASMEQIASQTKQNAANAEQANMLAVSASADAEQGNSQMKEMLAAMEQINESSGNISKIIKVIDEIAFQTNILALNAAVEAARAGQHGKGFAVVAEEVRNLAARSANAAKETTVLIEGSIKKVEAGTRIANDTAAALEKIVGGVGKAADLVGSIASASNEQAAGIMQANQGIAQVSEVIQANSATSEECAAASEELSGQSEQLKEMVGKFRLKRNASSTVFGGYEAYAGLDSNRARLAPAFARAEVAAASAPASGKPRIRLDDDDFGKYE
ncbi:HAMP domain-containing protein [Paenibacillus antri]|uniref:HAMP domain-containing protein n=1 Tax=Paenibacillus antri TaxID=2582848 RepID=A0A5R9G8I1_9BACL|nr:methyl-accepting chemotaxis protein [Paenibacillus antri]TLS49374.1 HAMP domain-containing protein [Paenibacillus antri]